MSYAIRIEDLSKKFLIGSKNSYLSLRDEITELLNFKKVQKNEVFWALRDINFEVKKGESIGIIGRNGAGKSTLLKILSRITPPTVGKIMIWGRVASMLEVGTGFNPELTGRENIFLNGAILGMSRSEIKNKFDEIVSFADIEKFLDTPVKRYSSGMYVRLAFAVAANLESEILIVDEVLAVGDTQFQKKCLGKMDEVAKKEGRTVLFVSHNMGVIQSLCPKTLYLNKGLMSYFGNTQIAVKRYLDESVRNNSLDFSQRKDRSGSQELIFTSVKFVDGSGCNVEEIISGNPEKIYLGFENLGNIKSASVSLSFNSMYGYRVLTLWSKFTGDILNNLPKKGYFECIIPKMPLRPGKYFIDVYAEKDGSLLDVIYNAAKIDIGVGNFYNTGQYPSESQGEFLVDHSWKTVHEIETKGVSIS